MNGVTAWSGTPVHTGVCHHRYWEQRGSEKRRWTPRGWNYALDEDPYGQDDNGQGQRSEEASVHGSSTGIVEAVTRPSGEGY